MPRLRRPNARAVAVLAAAAAAALLGASCAGRSAASELVGRLEGAPPLDAFEVRVSSSAANLFECFTPNGAFSVQATAPNGDVVVSEPGPAEPALVVRDGVVMLRPSEFSSGPDEWWELERGTPRTAIDAVVGPLVATAALDATFTNPAAQLRSTVAGAHQVTGGDDQYRIIERGADAAVLDVTLDAHGHPREVRVAAEDPGRSGEPSTTEPRYVATYRHAPAPPELDVDPVRTVSDAELDALDVGLGACEVQLGG